VADPAITGALVGGGIAVTTTVANLLYNWWQNQTARRFATRQQVYLEACEWAARGSEYLASFARLDLEDTQLSQILQSSGAAYYKVHVVAELSTARAFNAAAEYLGAQAAELMVQRVLLRQRVSQLHALQTEAEQTSSYLQQVTTLIDNLPKASPAPETLAAIPQLVAEFVRARDQLRGAQQQIASVNGEIVKGHEQLLGACLQATVGYGECLVAANIAARKELGMPLNEDDYRESVSAASRRVSEAVRRMVERFKASA
jgi:hypothetical protein